MKNPVISRALNLFYIAIGAVFYLIFPAYTWKGKACKVSDIFDYVGEISQLKRGNPISDLGYYFNVFNYFLLFSIICYVILLFFMNNLIITIRTLLSASIFIGFCFYGAYVLTENTDGVFTLGFGFYVAAFTSFCVFLADIMANTSSKKKDDDVVE